VDDNSDSDKVDFAKFPCLNDPYVEIVFGKNENGRKGAGYARNLGLERAKGKWLVFADADDFFVENAFNHLFIETDSLCDIIYFKGIYPTNALVKREEPDIIAKRIDDFVHKADDAENRLRYKYLVPWGKMIKMSVVKKRGIWFDEVIAGNDIMFSLLTGYYASSITAIDKTVYCVTVNRGSLSYTSSLNIIESRYVVLLRYNNFLKKHNKEKYQTASITYYLYLSCKYGINTFFKFIRLAINYKVNPFSGLMNVSRYISFRRGRKGSEKYVVKKK
jgi:glycosyltransferase involved in cell wall biosynthesis